MDSITRSNVFSVIALMREVIQEEENRGILQTNLIHMDYMLHYISTVFHEMPEAALETLKVWLQLLHNCLTQAKRILHLSNASQWCLDCLTNNPQRPSKQVKNWRVHFNYLFRGLESDISVIVRGREAVIAPVITPLVSLMKDVIEEEEQRHILQRDLRPLDDRLLDISALFQDQQKSAPEPLKIWLELLHNSLTEANTIFHRYGPSQIQRRRLDCLIGDRGRFPQQVKEWKVLFNYFFQGLQEEFSMFASADQIIKRDLVIPAMTKEGLLQPLSKDEAWEFSMFDSADQIIKRDLVIPAMTEEGLLQPLSKDEAWELFRGIAFCNDNPVPMDIEERAKNIADECKGSRLAIILVAAALRGKSRADEWETSLFSIKNPDPASPDTLPPRIDAELYQRFRWSYNALPNSEVKNCFLYCAMYPKNGNISVEELVEMWVAEGLVRSQQKNHLVDMDIGLSYVDLLVDRRLFHYPTYEEKFLWGLQQYRDITVHDVIREMAIYIGEKEENCQLKAHQGLQNFHNEDCKRISLLKNDIKSLPTEFPACPKLVSLMLSIDDSIEEVPPGFLVSLKSLKVLHLQKSSGINSIPSSLGQLKHLQFLSLRGLQSIEHLPKAIGNLSSLQFLDLQGCGKLQSLPSQIGKLKNLKHLNLIRCYELKVIPHEMSHLTSLTTLDAWGVALSVAAESEARSIWRLKGLRNLTTLSLWVKGTTSSSRIDEGIMGTWLHMRHLILMFDSDDVMVDLPHDMKKMSKLQFFYMVGYRGSSLPEYICKLQHLEAIGLTSCHQLRELSPLERVPNLKALRLYDCGGLKELGIGNSDGFLMLERLALGALGHLESIGGAFNNYVWFNNNVWNESTLPRLRILAISGCRKLKRLPVGMDKLPKLSKILACKEQWNHIIWEDDDMKIRLQRLYKEW